MKNQTFDGLKLRNVLFRAGKDIHFKLKDNKKV